MSSDDRTLFEHIVENALQLVSINLNIGASNLTEQSFHFRARLIVDSRLQQYTQSAKVKPTEPRSLAF